MSACKRTDTDSLVWGILLLLIGSAFLVDRLHIFSIHETLHFYWPMILIAIGVSRLFRRRGWGSGVTMIAIGLWLQAITSGLWDLTFSNGWPLLLIALGASTVIRALFDGTRRRRLAEDEELRHER